MLLLFDHCCLEKIKKEKFAFVFVANSRRDTNQSNCTIYFLV